MFRPQHHINKINNRIYSLMVMVINNIFSQGIKKIGRGFHIDTSSRIEAYRYSKVYIGQDCVIGRCTNVKVRDAELIIGDRVAFNDNCNITVRNKITIGNDVLVGPNVVIIDHDHNYRSSNWKTDFISDEIYIGKNVWIGANSVILKGSYIGDNSIIAAGTIVRGEIFKNQIMYEERKQRTRKYERS